MNFLVTLFVAVLWMRTHRMAKRMLDLARHRMLLSSVVRWPALRLRTLWRGKAVNQNKSESCRTISLFSASVCLKPHLCRDAARKTLEGFNILRGFNILGACFASQDPLAGQNNSGGHSRVGFIEFDRISPQF